MYRIFALCVILIACGSPRETKTDQLNKLAHAEKMLKEERLHLKTMQDSLQIKIQYNIEQLQFPVDQAEEIERALLKSQEAIVAAAERNVQARRTHLDSLLKYAP